MNSFLQSKNLFFSSPTNAILDSLDAVRQYLESPTSCKCGLQCPLIVEKVCLNLIVHMKKKFIDDF